VSSLFLKASNPINLLSPHGITKALSGKAFGSSEAADVPQLPTINDPKIEAEKRRQLAAALQRGGRQATILTGGQGVQGPILGTGAQLTGGVV